MYSKANPNISTFVIRRSTFGVFNIYLPIEFNSIDFIAEMKWRGMIHDIMPGTAEQLNQEMTSAYIGFDPTADSLHIGNLVQIMSLTICLGRRSHRYGG